MDAVTTWLNVAGDNAIDRIETTELLAKLSKTADERNRTRLINKICAGNLKLVYTTTKKYSDRRRLRWGTELSADLLQVGFLGLRHAVGRYDASRGTRLSTVAVPWIKQKLGRHLINTEAPIYIPENLVREVQHLKTHGRLSNSRSTPKNTQLVELARYAYAAPLSLDKPLNEEADGATLGEILEQPSTEGYSDKADRYYLQLSDALAKAGVSPKAQDLVLLYARKGNLTWAAKQCKIKVREASKILKDAITKTQNVV